MRLHFYFARKYLTILASVFAIFSLFLLMVDLVEQIRRSDTGELTFSEALELAAFNMPRGVYEILPLVVLLATLALFLGLARSSELVVARASGRSAMRGLVAPLVAALIAGAFAVSVMNPFVAATSQRFVKLKAEYRETVTSVTSISREGLWLRQASNNGQVVIRAERANEDATVLTNVTFFAFDADNNPAFRIEAATARLTPGFWQVTDAKRWDLYEAVENPELNATDHQSLLVATDLTGEGIRDSFGAPDAIPFWDLPGFISSLERAGFSARSHRVWLQMELALPFVFVAMTMIAAGFTMRHTRFGRTGLMVMLALGSGMAFFFLRSFAQVLGENGQIPVWLAAWSPPAIAILMTLGLLLHLEDG